MNYYHLGDDGKYTVEAAVAVAVHASRTRVHTRTSSNQVHRTHNIHTHERVHSQTHSGKRPGGGERTRDDRTHCDGCSYSKLVSILIQFKIISSVEFNFHA